MVNTGSSHGFEPLVIPRRDVPPSLNRYRVYKDHADYTVQEAASASEALQKSGLQQAYRIARDDLLAVNIINLNAIVIKPPVEAPAAPESAAKPDAAAPAEAPAAPPAEAVPPPPAAPAEAKPAEAKAATPEAALSSADVDKLLKS